MANTILIDLDPYVKEYVLGERMIRYLLPYVKNKPRIELSEKIIGFLNNLSDLNSNMDVNFFTESYMNDNSLISKLKDYYSNISITPLPIQNGAERYYFWGKSFRSGLGNEIVGVFSEDKEVSYPIVAAANNKGFVPQLFDKLDDIVKYAKNIKEDKNENRI